MATLIQIRNKVDTFLTDLWVTSIVPKQEVYFAKHGRYAQVLISPNNTLADGAEGPFKYLPPSDEKNIVDFTFTIDVPVPIQIEIHTHDSEAVHGFTVHAYVEVLGKLYHRAKNYKFGSADVAWHEVVTEKI